MQNLVSGFSSTIEVVSLINSLNLINKPSLSENSPLWVACVKNATLYYHHLRE